MRRGLRILFLSRFPVVTAVLLMGCFGGFTVELLLGRSRAVFLLKLGVVPLELVEYFRGGQGTTFLNSVLPFFTSLFLHGGFVHLLANVFCLWLVGDALEDWLGKTRFLVLFVFGAATELIVRIGVSGAPSGLASVGISGAVAALIGGYLVILTKVGRGEGQTVSVLTLLARLPLMLGVLVWFPIQLLNRHLAIAPTCQTDRPVSWLALMTSFVLGVFLLSLTGRRLAPTSAEATVIPTEESGEKGTRNLLPVGP